MDDGGSFNVGLFLQKHNEQYLLLDVYYLSLERVGLCMVTMQQLPRPMLNSKLQVDRLASVMDKTCGLNCTLLMSSLLLMSCASNTLMFHF